MSATSEKRFVLACFVACLALNAGFSLVGWTHPLTELHEFRATQTALSARGFAEEPWKLAYPLPLFGPPWSAPFEFPLYQATVGAVVRLTGLALEPSGRAVGLACLYLALPALYFLQEFLPIPRQRWLLLPAAALVSPVYAYYSRAFMIESTAFAAAAWFLLAAARAVDRRSGAYTVLALVLGVVAALTKATTFFVFLVPLAGLWVLRPLGSAVSAGWVARTTRLAVAVLPGLLAATAWTRFADGVKAGNALASELTSAQLHAFLFGPAAMRLDPGFWQRLLEHSGDVVMHPANAVLGLVLLALFGGARWKPALVLAAAFLAGPLAFANLYAVHDYYQYATGIFGLAALVLAWSAVLDAGERPAIARGLIIVVSLGLQFTSYALHYLPFQRHPLGDPPELARVLQAVTQPRDVVMILGQDWNPILPYHAHRRALMVMDRVAENPERVRSVLERLGPDDPVTALVVTGSFRNVPGVVQPLLKRLHLPATPLLMSPESNFYLSSARTDHAQDTLEQLRLAQFTLVDNSVETITVPRRRFAAAEMRDARFPQIANTPINEVIHPFALAIYELDGRPILDAHAPTDVVFVLPPGATTVTAEFGIQTAAWQAEQPTDGVEFRIELVDADTNRRRTLYSRFLRPLEEPGDRGLQRIELGLPPAAKGLIRFRTLPGPNDNIAHDWAYWQRMLLK